MDGADGRGESGARRGKDRGRRTLTASEAAAIIGVSVATVRGWADHGRLPSHRTVGGHRRFELEELREWLERRGAPGPEVSRLRRSPQEVPACPRLARELNARTQAIVDRVVSGYAPGVATPLGPSSDAALRRLAIRFLRVVTAALESGRPEGSAGRAEVAGFRGGMQGASGSRVIVEHTRVAAAILVEAEDAMASGEYEDRAIPALHSVIDHVQVAVLRGFEQARSTLGGA